MTQSKLIAAAAVGVLAVSLLATAPVLAQSRHDRDRRDNDDDRTEEVLIGAVVGALAGAVIGEGDGDYVLGGALAGAALGAASSNDGDCNYYRGGRCYRNQGHWEREHGINSRDRDYRYDRREDRRDYREERRDDRRDYRRDRRDDRRDNRDYSYDRRW